MPILDTHKPANVGNLDGLIVKVDNDVTGTGVCSDSDNSHSDSVQSGDKVTREELHGVDESKTENFGDDKSEYKDNQDTFNGEDEQKDDEKVESDLYVNPGSNTNTEIKNSDDGRHTSGIPDIEADEIPIDGKSTDRSDSEPEDGGDEQADILAALQSLTESHGDNPDEGSVLTGADLSDIFGPDEAGEDSHDDLTTPLAELGLATKTLTELDFTWDSTVDTSALGTLETHCTALDNQYLAGGTSSEVEGETRMGDVRGAEDMAFAHPVTGVTFDNRVNTYREPLKHGDEEEDGFSEMDIHFGRNASRLALESREAMFRRAMSLLSARCTSVKQDDADCGLPFGIQTPKYFYVTQDKPLPMEPLKAWRGYNGNVYFEPIHINHLKVDEAELLRAKTSVPRARQKLLTAKLASQPEPRLAITEKENKAAESRSESRQTNRSSQSNLSAARQMAILDRQAVAHRLNDSIQEDMVWIEGQEHTGSLAVRPRSHPDKRAHDRDVQYNKERIKKGSVVHKLYEEKKAKQRNAKLTVSGGKFTPPTSMSPLLRTQTQYSLSHRLTTNSPDPYHGDAKLPPLDHLRASLKHMNNKPATVAKGYTRSLTLTDDMKPFVKYSPDVVAKFAQQAAL